MGCFHWCATSPKSKQRWVTNLSLYKNCKRWKNWFFQLIVLKILLLVGFSETGILHRVKNQIMTFSEVKFTNWQEVSRRILVFQNGGNFWKFLKKWRNWRESNLATDLKKTKSQNLVPSVFFFIYLKPLFPGKKINECHFLIVEFTNWQEVSRCIVVCQNGSSFWKV